MSSKITKEDTPYWDVAYKVLFNSSVLLFDDMVLELLEKHGLEFRKNKTTQDMENILNKSYDFMRKNGFITLVDIRNSVEEEFEIKKSDKEISAGLYEQMSFITYYLKKNVLKVKR